MAKDEGPTILLVDDDPAHNQALTRILERAGYRVHATAGSYGALTILKQRPFDLVVTDLRMPGKTGLDLLRSIRATNTHLPAVVITAYGEWTSYLEAMNIGAVDYLTKPVRREDILSTMRRALARSGVRPMENPAPDSEGEPGGDAP
jgi:two-component system, NtrC family, response regulator AtoC